MNDFQNQLLLIGSVFGNKDTIKSFAPNYTKQLNLSITVAQKVLESRIKDTVKLGDSDKLTTAKAKLASLLKNQAHIIRARLKKCLPNQ